MEKDFTEWLKERYCAWYLLTQAQEDKYFSQWYDEMQEKRKEQLKMSDHTICTMKSMSVRRIPQTAESITERISLKLSFSRL